MSAAYYEPIILTSETLTAIARPNGRTRCPVFVYLSSDTEHPIATDTLNPASATSRAKLVQNIDAEHQAEADLLLARLADGICAAQPAPRDAQTPDPFPVIEPWETRVEGADLLDELVAFIESYMVLPEYGAQVFALWIVHTYVIDAADYTPYLHVHSPVRECGKSTLLELGQHLGHRAQMTGGTTAAALYRRIDKHSPTMLIDECDARLRGDGSENFRGVLNTGFHRSGRVTICVSAGDDFEERDFSTFGPKVLAGIGKLWDTVMSRSIPLRLNRATKAQLAGLTKIRGDRISAACEPFRRKLRRLADDIGYNLRLHDAPTPDQLSARQADVWRPLLAIADQVGGHWPVTARAAAVAIHGVHDEEGDFGLLLLADVRDLFATRKTHVLPSVAIVHALVDREDRPWPEYRHGQPISARGIAALLGRFDIKPKAHRIGGDVVKGYTLDQLQPAFNTYLPPIPSDLSVTSVTRGPEGGADADVTDVTDRNEENGPTFFLDDPTEHRRIA